MYGLPPEEKLPLGAVGSSAWFGGGNASGPGHPAPVPGRPADPARLHRRAGIRSPSSHQSTPPLLGTTLRRLPAARATERYASGAAGSRSEARAEAGSGRLQAFVRCRTGHRPPPWQLLALPGRVTEHRTRTPLGVAGRGCTRDRRPRPRATTPARTALRGLWGALQARCILA